ncbi:hypothetical protein KY363_02345 [Candidatus Woesearchaeota archaeon]|nr:hypothetical protein [Candidatus Woesearchaeota archaeon]
MDYTTIIAHLVTFSQAASLLILAYVIFTLAKSETSYVKDHLLLHTELMQRDRIFRQSLFILLLSVLFTLIGTVFDNYGFGDAMANAARLVGSLLRVWFVLNLLKTVRVTKH